MASKYSGPYEALYFYYTYKTEYYLKGVDAEIAPGLTKYLVEYTDKNPTKSFEDPKAVSEQSPKGLATFAEFVWFIEGNDPKALAELKGIMEAGKPSPESKAEAYRQVNEVPMPTRANLQPGETFEEAWKNYMSARSSRWEAIMGLPFKDPQAKKGPKAAAKSDDSKGKGPSTGENPPNEGSSSKGGKPGNDPAQGPKPRPRKMNLDDVFLNTFEPRTDGRAHSIYHQVNPGDINFDYSHISIAGSRDSSIVRDSNKGAEEYMKVFQAVGARIRVLSMEAEFRDATNMRNINHAMEALEHVIEERDFETQHRVVDRDIAKRVTKIGLGELPTQPTAQEVADRKKQDELAGRVSDDSREEYVRKMIKTADGEREYQYIDMNALREWLGKPGVVIPRKQGESEAAWRARDVAEKQTIFAIETSKRGDSHNYHLAVINQVKVQLADMQNHKDNCRS